MGRRAHLPKVYVYFMLHRILHLLTIPQTLKICSHRPRSTTRHPRFADLSTRVLKSANWNLPQPTTLRSSFPNLATTLGLWIRALLCSILQNRVPLRTHHSRSCKFEHASARIGKTEPPRPPTTPGSANSSSPSTHHSWFCKFEHASARIGKTESSCTSTTPGPANSSAQVLELAKPSLLTHLLPLVLPIRARKCSNWQNQVPLCIHHPRSCKFKRASARIGKTKSPCTPTTLGSANSSAQVLELAIPNLPAHHLRALPPTTLVSASSSTQVLELAKSSLLALAQPSFISQNRSSI